MKTLIIAAAAAATLAGFALPAAAQSWDRDGRSVQVQTRFVEPRFDRDGRDGAWRSFREREIERRMAERRRLEWLMHHRHDAYGYRDNGYGYGYGYGR